MAAFQHAHSNWRVEVREPKSYKARHAHSKGVQGVEERVGAARYHGMACLLAYFYTAALQPMGMSIYHTTCKNTPDP